MRECAGKGKGAEDEQPVQRLTKHARGKAHWVPLSGQPSRLSLVGLRTKEKDLGDDLLSQTVASPVPSALTGLTAVFGMGTGVSPSLWSPKSFSSIAVRRSALGTELSHDVLNPARVPL